MKSIHYTAGVDETTIIPWDNPAPERAGLPSAWSLFPEELAERGCPGSALETFKRLHRPWTWKEGVPDLGDRIRPWLEGVADLCLPAIIERQPSSDGSTKLILELTDGKRIEAVHMPRRVRNPRVTYCLSSQVGCAMGCTFCATGQMGIIRNVSAAEIVGQVVSMLNHHAHPQDRPVNLVFMGMGEPLHNFDHLMAAFETLTDAEGLAIPPRRITVSTSGLVSGIDRLGTFARRPRLALSLNGTTDEDRSRIMPVNRVWNLEALAQALGRFPLQSGERITIEYVLLKGVTDRQEDGRRLATFARRFPAKVNLIPFNPHEGSGFEPPEESRIGALCRLLSDADLPVSVRRSRGQDVTGACGQLIRLGHSRKSLKTDPR